MIHVRRQWLCLKTTSSRSNCGRKGKLSERDVQALTQIESRKHKTTAAVLTVEINVHFNSHVCLVLHRVNIHGLPNLWSLMLMPNVGFNGANSANLGLWTM